MLTTAKLAHIRRQAARSHQGRAQVILMTFKHSDGSTYTQTYNAVWRVMGDFEPTLEGPTNQRTHLGADADINAIFLHTDITLATLRSCIHATPVDATGQPGALYVLLDIEPIGIPPGGDRIFTKWTKQK